jgi:excisionase family DNA binding protein
MEPREQQEGKSSAFLDVNGLCDLFALSREFVYKAAAKGILPCYRFGRALRFDPNEVRQWMRQPAKKLDK